MQHCADERPAPGICCRQLEMTSINFGRKREGKSERPQHKQPRCAHFPTTIIFSLDCCGRPSVCVCMCALPIEECATTGSGRSAIECIKDLSHVERTYSRKRKCDAIDFSSRTRFAMTKRSQAMRAPSKRKLPCRRLIVIWSSGIRFRSRRFSRRRRSARTRTRFAVLLHRVFALCGFFSLILSALLPARISSFRLHRNRARIDGMCGFLWPVVSQRKRFRLLFISCAFRRL